MSLFGNKSEKETEKVSNERNIIGKGTTITGHIETFGNILIDGRLNGNIKSKSKVVLGQGSTVEGDILAQKTEIEGEVIGRIEVTDIVILHPTAVIKGDIITAKLVVKSGAIMNGNTQVGIKANKEIKIDNNATKERAKATA